MKTMNPIHPNKKRLGEAKKEKGWNERFYPGQIPKYTREGAIKPKPARSIFSAGLGYCACAASNFKISICIRSFLQAIQIMLSAFP